MLTNSIILFLRDLLPVFIMLAYLQALVVKPAKQVQFTLLVSASVFIFSSIVFVFFENISELAEGNGLEWFEAISLSLGFALILAFLSSKGRSRSGALTIQTLVVAGAVLISSTHVSSLLLFLNIYFSNKQNLLELFIGCAIGFGISLSFYLLFVFVLHELVGTKFKSLVKILFALFLAGQVAVLANLFQQIDLLSIGGNVLFDASKWINESTEYGYLMKALFGFEASPTAAYLSLFAITFLISFILLLREKRTLINGAYNE